MSEIRAYFEPKAWKDFSKEHETLRHVVQKSLHDYKRPRFQDPIAVWGAYGAGKTQFLFWVAEEAVAQGFVPVYLHLNDLLDDMPEEQSPDTFKRHAVDFVRDIAEKIASGSDEDKLLSIYRDRNLLQYVRDSLSSEAVRPIVLLDEVEQAYGTLVTITRADDRSPLRAWLEEETFKILAFAVGSLYVLGKADRERLRVYAIPPVRPTFAKSLFPTLDEESVNALWWVSRGKPRHLLKAATRFQEASPSSAIEIHAFMKQLDSVSQAPYEGDSQSAVPSAYVDLLSPDEVTKLFSIGPCAGTGEGKLFKLEVETEEALLAVVREAFKMEDVAYDLVKYVMLLAEALSSDGVFALTEVDTPYLLRLAVDFLLEYERERIEKETVEGGAALSKLLEVHDTAKERAGEIFWKLQGKVETVGNGEPSLPYASIYSVFPLPTTSPCLFGTDPKSIRTRYDELKEPVFRWYDSQGNVVFFLTSVTVLEHVSSTTQFRENALGSKNGIIVLTPHDSIEYIPSGFLDWLAAQNRLVVNSLPVALSEFLLSLRSYSSDGSEPFPIAEQASTDKNLRRQVSFYRARLESYVNDVSHKPERIVPSGTPKTFSNLVNRVADKELLSLGACQSFESIGPSVQAHLYNLRQLVMNTRTIWQRSGFVVCSLPCSLQLNGTLGD